MQSWVRVACSLSKNPAAYGVLSSLQNVTLQTLDLKYDVILNLDHEVNLSIPEL